MGLNVRVNLEDIIYIPETGEFRAAITPPIGHIDKHLGYCVVTASGKKYLGHRLAFYYMTGEWPKGDVDHIDHNRANNKWDNLRIVTRQENLKNCRRQKNNKSGITGVFKTKTGIYQVSLGAQALGSFDNIFDATACRISAQNKAGYHANHGT